MPATVPPDATALAMPKSISTTRPARVSMTFSGLTSRWTSPASWMAPRPARSCRAISRASVSSSGLRVRSTWPQGDAVHVLHRDELETLGLDEVVDPADVRGGHRAGGTDLGPQARDRSRVIEPVGQQRLERHLDLEPEVPGEPDLSHSASPEDPADLVPPAQHPADARRSPRLPLGRVERRALHGQGELARPQLIGGRHGTTSCVAGASGRRTFRATLGVRRVQEGARRIPTVSAKRHLHGRIQTGCQQFYASRLGVG